MVLIDYVIYTISFSIGMLIAYLFFPVCNTISDVIYYSSLFIIPIIIFILGCYLFVKYFCKKSKYPSNEIIYLYSYDSELGKTISKMNDNEDKNVVIPRLQSQLDKGTLSIDMAIASCIEWIITWRSGRSPIILDYAEKISPENKKPLIIELRQALNSYNKKRVLEIKKQLQSF